jgi:hypothetical protein
MNNILNRLSILGTATGFVRRRDGCELGGRIGRKGRRGGRG